MSVLEGAIHICISCRCLSQRPRQRNPNNIMGWEKSWCYKHKCLRWPICTNLIESKPCCTSWCINKCAKSPQKLPLFRFNLLKSPITTIGCIKWCAKILSTVCKACIRLAFGAQCSNSNIKWECWSAIDRRIKTEVYCWTSQQIRCLEGFINICCKTPRLFVQSVLLKWYFVRKRGCTFSFFNQVSVKHSMSVCIFEISICFYIFKVSAERSDIYLSYGHNIGKTLYDKVVNR